MELGGRGHNVEYGDVVRKQRMEGDLSAISTPRREDGDLRIAAAGDSCFVAVKGWQSCRRTRLGLPGACCVLDWVGEDAARPRPRNAPVPAAGKV